MAQSVYTVTDIRISSTNRYMTAVKFSCFRAGPQELLQGLERL